MMRSMIVLASTRMGGLPAPAVAGTDARTFGLRLIPG